MDQGRLRRPTSKHQTKNVNHQNHNNIAKFPLVPFLTSLAPDGLVGRYLNDFFMKDILYCLSTLFSGINLNTVFSAKLAAHHKANYLHLPTQLMGPSPSLKLCVGGPVTFFVVWYLEINKALIIILPYLYLNDLTLGTINRCHCIDINK